ncbi:efflux RND transporter permease subunit [Labrys wisconsinensis]|uniref:Multidrug efflux pump n=1 Tax=Labrys wisconsinensis TaxID=425677 RepID=A0ABU0J2G8_9HYPH|nr:efflux RND transporter permease subunit [Labrys wisconsinensis]MDQ0467638.1 multidrug efflux pump [Labrys wisconsinensis]
MTGVSTPFIRRPVATSLLGIAVMLGGLLGYLQLPVAPLPQVDFPTIQVTTQLPGANAGTMAALVTAPLERQLGQIPSLASMVSSSAFGISQVTLQFDLGRDIDGAAQDVQAAINAAGSTLPRTLPYPPTYAKVNPADTPIVTLALRSDSYSIRQLSDIADTLLAQRLAEVSGIGHVEVQGGVRPALRIQADIARLAAYGLGLEDLRTAIANSSVAGPKGSLDGTHQSYTIAANDQITAIHAYKDIIVAQRGDAPVRLRDVADVVDGLENTRVAATYQGRPAVVIDILRQPGANVIDTVGRILDTLPRLRGAIPAGISLEVVHDRTETIRASIHDVEVTLVIAIGLVILVVLMFLRTLRATIIAGVALPLSVIATFGVMWLAGFSLDNLSLMALTIGTGFIVDDAIVMIENIVRHIEDGEDPLDAALAGAREIGFTVISLTVSLIAVFIPLLFMSGIVGRMFREFALTLTIAVVVSAVISLTLTPMMCARLLRRTPHRERGLMSAFNAGVDWVIAGYHRSLLWVVDRTALMLGLTALTLAATLALYVVIPKGFLPPQDTGLITAVVQAEPTVSFEAMRTAQGRVAAIAAEDRDITGVVSSIGVSATNLTPNTGALTLVLKPRAERSSAAAIIARLQGATAHIPGVSATFQATQDIQISTRASRAPFQYTLTGTESADVTGWAERFAARLRQEPALRDVASEAQDGGAELFVKIDREAASRLGVSVQAVSDTLNDAFGQRQIATIYAQANQYRVILEAQPRYLADSNALQILHVPGGVDAQTTLPTTVGGTVQQVSSSGTQVPLSAVATVSRRTAPLVIEHDEQFPAVTVSFDLASGASLSDAVEAIDRAQADIAMPASITGRYSGDAAEFAQSLANEPWLILAAVVTIYIVLGVLYESAIHPITILSTLPSAGVGALLALMALDMDLSVIGLIGIVLLMGIVKKNAIMMIDFALEAERGEGLGPREAIVKACLLRFRPIMMTTLAALFGALPLALQHGTGSELRIPLGVTIIGGLILSQLLTLYTTPVIYLALERLRVRLAPAAPEARPPSAIGHGAVE